MISSKKYQSGQFFAQQNKDINLLNTEGDQGYGEIAFELEKSTTRKLSPPERVSCIRDTAARFRFSHVPLRWANTDNKLFTKRFYELHILFRTKPIVG